MEKDRCDEWLISSDSAGDRYLCDKGLSPVSYTHLIDLIANDRITVEDGIVKTKE